MIYTQIDIAILKELPGKKASALKKFLKINIL